VALSLVEAAGLSVVVVGVSIRINGGVEELDFRVGIYWPRSEVSKARMQCCCHFEFLLCFELAIWWMGYRWGGSMR